MVYEVMNLVFFDIHCITSYYIVIIHNCIDHIGYVYLYTI